MVPQLEDLHHLLGILKQELGCLVSPIEQIEKLRPDVSGWDPSTHIFGTRTL